jgi:hypothetical protein
VYDYLLGGKDNFAADRAVGDQLIAQLPAVQVGVRAQRDLLGRVVRYLVGEAGLGQLLDIGSGLPTAENVHELAHRIDPRRVEQPEFVVQAQCLARQAGCLGECPTGHQLHACLLMPGGRPVPSGSGRPQGQGQVRWYHHYYQARKAVSGTFATG